MRKNNFFKILIVVLLITSVEAKLTRKINKNEVQEFSASDGVYSLKGSLYKGMYFSPEDTFCFLIPELDKKGFKLIDKCDGTKVTKDFSDAKEVAAIFTDQSGHYFRLDVFMVHGEKDVKKWHTKNNHAPKGTFLVEDWIKEPKFDLDESNAETPIFMTLMNTEGEKSNAYQVAGMVMANNKIYMLTTIKHGRKPASQESSMMSNMMEKFAKEKTGADFSASESEKLMTLEEKKAEAKDEILKLMARLFIWPEGKHKRGEEKKSGTQK